MAPSRPPPLSATQGLSQSTTSFSSMPRNASSPLAATMGGGRRSASNVGRPPGQGQGQGQLHGHQQPPFMPPLPNTASTPKSKSNGGMQNDMKMNHQSPAAGGGSAGASSKRMSGAPGDHIGQDISLMPDIRTRGKTPKGGTGTTASQYNSGVATLGGAPPAPPLTPGGSPSSPNHAQYLDRTTSRTNVNRQYAVPVSPEFRMPKSELLGRGTTPEGTTRTIAPSNSPSSPPGGSTSSSRPLFGGLLGVPMCLYPSERGTFARIISPMNQGKNKLWNHGVEEEEDDVMRVNTSINKHRVTARGHDEEAQARIQKFRAMMLVALVFMGGIGMLVLLAIRTGGPDDEDTNGNRVSSASSSASSTSPNGARELPLSDVQSQIISAIATGAPLFNNGDACAAYRAYDTTTVGLLEGYSIPREVSQALQSVKGLGRTMQTSEDCSWGAWQHRFAFDTILEMTTSEEDADGYVNPIVVVADPVASSNQMNPSTGGAAVGSGATPSTAETSSSSSSSSNTRPTKTLSEVQGLIRTASTEGDLTLQSDGAEAAANVYMALVRTLLDDQNSNLPLDVEIILRSVQTSFNRFLGNLGTTTASTQDIDNLWMGLVWSILETGFERILALTDSTHSGGGGTAGGGSTWSSGSTSTSVSGTISNSVSANQNTYVPPGASAAANSAVAGAAASANNPYPLPFKPSQSRFCAGNQ
ncbi:unnamed protein product [Amoebophrya sp. A25]|nr:unnamed protein product [Amoebophrya sp. A25]|eukprot:GSA25T00014707001.1